MSVETYCPIKNSECKVLRPLSAGLTCFVAIPYKDEWKDTRETIRKALRKVRISPYVADEEITAGRDILCKICEKISNSDFGVIEVSTINPNVMFEFGLTLGRRKPVFIICNKALSDEGHIIPSDIVALERIEYKNQKTLEKKLTEGFQQFLSRQDIKKKRLDVMMDLARASASDEDFSTTTSLLETIGVSLASRGRLDGPYIELLEDVVKLAEKEPDGQIGFALALIKFLALNNKKEQVNSYLDFVCEKLVLLSRKGLQTGKKDVDMRAVREIVTRADKGKLLSSGGYIGGLWMIETRDYSQSYAHLWQILSKVSDKEKFLEDLTKYTSLRLERMGSRGSLPFVGRILQDRNARATRYAAWIQSVAEFGKDPKLRQYAKKKSAKLQKELKDCYHDYSAQKERFILRASRSSRLS